MLAKCFPNCICLFIGLAFSSLTFQSGSSDPLNIVVFSGPLLTSSSTDNYFRGYVLQNDKDIRDLSVGILYKNIDGKDNVTWDDTGYVSGGSSRDMPDGKIFNTSSNIVYRVHTDFTFLGVSNLQPQTDRVGVFSFKAKRGEVVTNSAIVLFSESATIAMEYRTITVGIGESVTINLSKGGSLNDLRWRHNYGEEIGTLRGSTSAVINNIRMKDDGVYECYTGDSPDGKHGIMRLIVRACPSPKWNPPDCEMDCHVCYNGGICDDKTGVCICPAGFQGSDCLQSCGNNYFGRDCQILCSSRGFCDGHLICPPDPIGCACINGFGENDCKTVCTDLYPDDTNVPDEDLYYGADCRQKCNCANEDCNRSPSLSNQDIGCTSGSTCLTGYTGNKCLEPTSCPSGFFGVLCNFPCHCRDSDDCNRDGGCDNGCHEAWAGPNCSIALPYRSEPPAVVNQTATTLKFDVTWILGEVYGTGTISKRKLSYKSSQIDSFISVTEPDDDVFLVIDDLIPNMQYQFYSQLSRMVDGIEVDGPRSTLGTTNTICSEPLDVPEIDLKTVEDNRIILRLKPVSSEYDRIQCNSILQYQVKYSDIDGNVQGLVSTSSAQLEVEFSDLSSCTAYVINARVVNNMDFAGSWGQDITVQTAPSEPLIESNPFTNGTHLLIKWKASMCENQVIYYYDLSGDGLVLQGNTTETEVVFGEGIESSKEYTFTVLASYLNVNGTSENKKVMFGSDCDQTKGCIIGFVIGPIISAVITVAITLIFQRFRRKHSERDVGKSSVELNATTQDRPTDQSLSKQYELESEYESIRTGASCSTEHVYTKPKPSVAEHAYGNSIVEK